MTDTPAAPQYRRISDSVYEAVCDYLRDRQDVRDGGDGTPLPNDAMHLLFQLTDSKPLSDSAPKGLNDDRRLDCSDMDKAVDSERRCVEGLKYALEVSNCAQPIVSIAMDGRVFWKGREVETDDEFRAAMLELNQQLVANMRPTPKRNET